MLREQVFKMFLTQVGTVAAITVCIVGVMALFYGEIVALNKCDPESDPEKPLEAPVRPLDECA